MGALLRSGPFKIALAFAASLIVTTYLVLGAVYLNLYASNVLLVRSSLEDEIVRAQAAPVDHLRREFATRLTQDLRILDYVALYDKSGALVFGNVAPGTDVPRDGRLHLITTRSPQPDDPQVGKTLLIAAARPDGGAVVLGKSLVYAEQLQSAILRGSTLAIVPVILLALLLGLIVSLQASRRLAALRTAIDRVMQGELYVRLPARGRRGDIDALVRAINQMLDELVRLVHQIKSVGDNIAHDLRAPLAVMRARLERGLAGASGDRLRALTEEALLDLERAMTTVTALLRISELESGLRRSAFGEVDLVRICSEAFDLYEPLAESKGIALRLEPGAPLSVSGDGDLLREALVNLVDNAIKFTPPGGRVTIACAASDALIRVADTGPGVAAVERDKIDRRFYRSKSTGHLPGTGLGLSMATTIIELHGFGLRIGDNAPGAVFEIIAAPKARTVGGLTASQSTRKLANVDA